MHPGPNSITEGSQTCLAAVNHQKARAIFLDPGEEDARAVEELGAAFLRDPIPGLAPP